MVAERTKLTVKKSIEILHSWILSQQYRGWDIYDGLNSPLTRNIKNPLIRVLVLQTNKYSPFNIRPLLGVEKGIDLKGMTLFAQAFALLYKSTGEDHFRIEMEKAIQFIKDKSLKETQKYDCWASHYYPYTGIDKSTLSLDIPDIIGTSQAIIALIESYKITKNPVEKEIASSAVKYLVDELFIDDEKMPFFKYKGSNEKPSHIILNASAQAIEAISAFQNMKEHSNLHSICEKVSRTLLQNQRDDGSWVYSIYNDGRTKRVQLDFHQGYIIDGLLAFLPYASNKDALISCIEKGAAYYRNTLFRNNGTSYYRYPIPFPVDIHNQAQGIITFNKMGRINKEYLDFAKKIGQWTINNMQDKNGFFYYQKWPLITNKIPHMRWGQAWMMLALSQLLRCQVDFDD